MKSSRAHKGRATRRHTNKRHGRRHTNKRHSGRRHTNKRHSGRHTKHKSTKGGRNSSPYSVALNDAQQKLADANNAMRDNDPKLRKAQNKYNEKMNKKCPPLDCVIDKQLLNGKISPEKFKSIQRYLNSKLPFYKKLSEQDIITCIDIFQTKCSAKADVCHNIDYTRFNENLSEDEVNELMKTLKTEYNLTNSELEKCITDNQFKKGKNETRSSMKSGKYGFSKSKSKSKTDSLSSIDTTLFKPTNDEFIFEGKFDYRRSEEL
jgi:hypothetical protein